MPALPHLSHRLLADDRLRAAGTPRADLAPALAQLEAYHRSLGAVASLTRRIGLWSDRWPKTRPTTILDLTGAPGHVAEALALMPSVVGHDARISVVEPSAPLAELVRARVARHRRIEVIQRPPLDVLRAGGEWTYVTGILHLPELPAETLPDLVRLMDGITRRGICVTAIERSWLTWLITRGLMFSPDSILGAECALQSVRQGLTRYELSMAVESTGCLYLDWWYELWGRVTLAGEKRDL